MEEAKQDTATTTDEQPLTLESGIAIPEVKRPGRTGGNGRYSSTLKAMRVGQSFKVECSKEDIDKTRSSICSEVSRLRERDNMRIKCVTRSIDGGLRVWRV
jgi:hypothetical protein